MTDLYHSLILEHNARPRFYEKRPEATHIVEAQNPICGDRFRLFLEVKNGVIAEATFHGYGCAVSKASTSVLVSALQGLPVGETSALIEYFLTETGLRAGDVLQSPPPVELPERTAFSAARHFPERIPCVTLAWEALEQYFQKTQIIRR